MICGLFRSKMASTDLKKVFNVQKICLKIGFDMTKKQL